MQPTDERAHHEQIEWAYEMVLDCQPTTGFARAFVSHHLVAHRLFHLVDIGRVVAGQLAGNPFMRARTPVALTMSRTGSVVLLTVDPRREPASDGLARPIETWHGTRAVGTLSLEWGVNLRPGRPTGLWATLDARRHRDAVAAVVSTMSFPQQQTPVGSMSGG